jgi:hypothetical protein
MRPRHWSASVPLALVALEVRDFSHRLRCYNTFGRTRTYARSLGVSSLLADERVVSLRTLC